MNRRICLALISVPLCFILACGGSNLSTTQPTVTDVYAAGYVVNGTDTIPTYWKNGVEGTLNGASGGYANSIFVSGNDVYVAGVDVSYGPVYWKNGVPTSLPGGSSANAIFVSGSDVYVAGQTQPSPQENAIAVYWKNGTLIPLTDWTHSADAWSIFVSGSDVYVGGSENETISTGVNSTFDGSFSKYWKNSTPIDLTDGMYGGVGFSIFVANGIVYGTGNTCDNFIPDCAIASAWNNGALTELVSQTDSTGSSIFVSGSDIYVSGTLLNNSAVYWKNGVLVNLTNGNSESAANQIAVSGSDVYVGGADWNEQGQFAQYWKNGVPVHLTDGTQAASVFAIALATL